MNKQKHLNYIESIAEYFSREPEKKKSYNIETQCWKTSLRLPIVWHLISQYIACEAILSLSYTKSVSTCTLWFLYLYSMAHGTGLVTSGQNTYI